MKSPRSRLEVGLLEHPIAQDSEALVFGHIADTALMPILPTSLDIKRFSEKEALRRIRDAYPRLKLSIVRQKFRSA